VLVDGKSVYEHLAVAQPDALLALCDPRSAQFGGTTGHLGSTFTLASDGTVAVRLRLDELVRFSPDVTRWLPTLRSAMDRHAMTIQLAPGEGYVLNNHRWLHGRRAFTGQRIMHRVLGNALAHLSIPAGFVPRCGEAAADEQVVVPRAWLAP
jgi:hypothetical protein